MATSGGAGLFAPVFDFGSGADGAVVLDGTNTYPSFTTTTGAAPNLTYILTRNVSATSFTVNAGITLYMGNPPQSTGGPQNAYRIRCTGVFTNNGTVAAPGAPANASVAGLVWGGAGAPGSGSQGATGTTGNGSNSGGINATSSVGVAGHGGSGGTGQATTGGVGGALAVGVLRDINTIVWPNYFCSFAIGVSPAQIGTGGGSGGGDGTNSGGGGGGPGGPVHIIAAGLTGSGTFSAVGGLGGTPTAGNCGSGGGGGGGYVLLVSPNNTFTGTINVSGGSPGTPTGTGTAGTMGAAGVAQQVTSWPL